MFTTRGKCDVECTYSSQGVSMLKSIFVFVLTLLSVPVLAGVSLEGQVLDDARKPVVGATVFMHSAYPREGTSSFCPTCYPDCQKRARTNAEGRFTIKDLDGSLVFRVLVAGSGLRPQFIDDVDPAEAPVAAVVSRRGHVDPKRELRGVVINQKEKSIGGAVITPVGFSTKEGSRFGGFDDGEALAVSNDDGSFALEVPSSPTEALWLVRIEARDVATCLFNKLTPGAPSRVYRLREGASIVGRLMKHGQPVAHREVGLVQQGRNIETFTGALSVATNDDGVFLFVNVPADDDYVFFGKTDSLASLGALSDRPVRAPSDGKQRDLGELELEPGLKMSGRISMPDNAPIPPGTRLLVSRLRAWDSATCVANRDGTFSLVGLPKEMFHLGLSIPGYRIARSSPYLDKSSTPPVAMIKLERDMSDVTLAMEKE
jgi:hypothetical protein